MVNWSNYVPASAGAGQLFHRIRQIAFFDKRRIGGGFPCYLLFSFLATVVFYIQHLKRGGLDAGFLYTGDVLGYFWPSLLKLRYLFGNHHFSGIDFSLYNGSSDFLLAANLINVHPLVVFFSLLAPSSLTLQQAGLALVIMLALHSFLSCYYAHRLCCEYFDMPFLLGGLVGVVFSFSYYTINGLGEPPFVFSTAVLPWIAYATLRFVDQPSAARLLWASLPIICGILGGYGPVGLVSLGLALVTVWIAVFLKPVAKPTFALTRTLWPFVCAGIVVLPYLYALAQYNASTPSATSANLFFSAFQLAEAPQAVLRIISWNLKLSSPFYEFTPTIGLVASSVVVLFFISRKSISALSAFETRLLYICLAIFSISILAIYGEFSPVSNLVYNFLPISGKMHIYQRFLFSTNLFFAIALGLMVKAVVTARPPVATRSVWLIWAILTLACAYLVGQRPAIASELNLNNYLVFELMLAALATGALLLPGARPTYAAITFTLFLVPLWQMYAYSQQNNTFEAQIKRIPTALNLTTQETILQYMASRSKKDVIKYVDITPLWSKEGVEPFMKAFPWFVVNRIRLSSYGGPAFYLQPRAEYMSKHPVRGLDVAVYPDWNSVLAQGADFAVVPGEKVRNGLFEGVLDAAAASEALSLPGDVLILPLRQHADVQGPANRPSYDNGVFRITPGPLPTERSRTNIALNNPTTQSSGDDARLATDGNTDGDLNRGSVTHTGLNRNAWLQVDLGRSATIDAVTLWNRTDCCGERLQDYWVLLSDDPLPSDVKASDLAKRPGVWGRHLISAPNPKTDVTIGGRQARYVRVQLAGTQPADQSYLSLAELQVFEAGAQPAPKQASGGTPENVIFATNDANRMILKVAAQETSTLQYLMSENPRLRFTLNGSEVRPREIGGLPSFELPPGQSDFRVVYHHPWMTLFWWLYFGYFALLAGLWLLPFLLALRAWPRPKTS